MQLFLDGASKIVEIGFWISTAIVTWKTYFLAVERWNADQNETERARIREEREKISSILLPRVTTGERPTTEVKNLESSGHARALILEIYCDLLAKVALKKPDQIAVMLRKLVDDLSQK